MKLASVNGKKRVQRLKQNMISSIPKVCIERASILTDSYVATEGEEATVRRARALKDILSQMSIYILDDEIIVGNQASEPRAAPVFPEYSTNWIEEELDHLSQRSFDRFLITEQNKRNLRRKLRYWKRKTHEERTQLVLGDIEVFEKAHNTGAIYAKYLLHEGDGHLIVNYEKVLRNGLRGIKNQAIRELERLNLTDLKDVKKRSFLLSIPIVCDAAVLFAKRFSDKARELANNTIDPNRKRELEEISEISSWVPGRPARTFHEALQSLWFIHLILQIESNGHSISLGRFDQYMRPFYDNDVKKGRLTRDGALELIEHMWIKLLSINKLRPHRDAEYLMGYPMFQNLTISGQLFNRGSVTDATNDLSYLCLDATADTRSEQPSLSARIHNGSPDKFLMKCTEVIKLGTGMPALFNDEVIIPALVNTGITLEDAYNYAPVGCVEVAVPGKWGYRVNGAGFLNMPKILELALNNGTDPKTGIQLHKGNGNLESFDSFDEVLLAWEEQLKFYTKVLTMYDTILDTFLERVPNIFCSALVDECIKRGKTIKEGGAVYDIVVGVQVGIVNVANSLAAIKKLVFEDKKITTYALSAALNRNFTGERDEILRQMLINKSPKFGNDDDYVDSLAKWVCKSYLKEISQYKNPRYGRSSISTVTVTAGVPLGSFVGATADGRKSGVPLSDGISPVHSTEKLSPTAVIKSVSKLPNIWCSGGNLLNMKFSPALLEDERRLLDFLAFIKTFCMLKCWHVQFNMVSAQVLKEAQENPEKYQDLLIRVAGYTARFVTLDRRIQNDIIDRTEYTNL